MRSHRHVILFMILLSTTGSVAAQTHRNDAVVSTLNATLVGREVASEVIRNHADEMRSIAVFEACDHKDLAAPLRNKFRPDWSALAEQRIKPKRITSQPFYFLPMISNYGNAVTESLINGYSGAVRDLLATGIIDKGFCEPEKLQKYLH